MDKMIELMEECSFACEDLFKDMTEAEADKFLTGSKRRAWDAGEAMSNDRERQSALQRRSSEWMSTR